MLIDGSAQFQSLQCLLHPSRLHNFYLYLSLVELLIKIGKKIRELLRPFFWTFNKWDDGINPIGKNYGQGSDITDE
jgi:hypothetical protein